MSTTFSAGVEVLFITRLSDGWEEAQLAVDGTPCVPFQYHVSQVAHMSADEKEQFLERQARTYLSRYGDARQPRPDYLVTEQEEAVHRDIRG